MRTTTAAVLGTALAGGLLLAAPSAQAAEGVSFTATLGGTAVAGSDANDPLRLEASDDVVLQVQVTNSGSTPLEVRSVRVSSQVLGLSFFTYSTRVDLVVPPGTTGDRAFALDLADLDGQATGTLPAKVELLSPERDVLAEEGFAVDVRGSLSSVYGVFGLAVAALTAVLLVGLLVRMVGGRLPASRVSRAWRFMLPGLGLGLTATFTASVLRVLVPSPGTSLVLVGVCAAVGFALGYLSPQPDDGSEDDELDERDVDLDAGLGVLEREPVGALAQPSAPATVDLEARPGGEVETGRETATRSYPLPPPSLS